MQLVTRAVVQPTGGGDPIEIMDLPLPEGVAPEVLLDYYRRTLGEPIDTAIADLPGLEQLIAVGWAFPVPDTFELPGPAENYELLVLPMLTEPDRDPVSLFAALAARNIAESPTEPSD